MHQFIIGVHGKIGSGKDTFADIAINEYNYTQVSFAFPLKDEVAAFLQKYNINFEEKNIWGTQDDKEQPLAISNIDDICKKFFPFTDFKHKSNNGNTTFRYLLQWWGTDYRREMCSESYWVDIFLNTASMYKKVVCADVRFENEVNAIKSINGNLVFIDRPDNFKSNSATHESESLSDTYSNWDYSIYNNDSLERYRDMCREVIQIIELKGGTNCQI